MNESTFGALYDVAVSHLDAVGGDMDRLSIPLQTLLIVESVQGIIDNGGLEYLYEADFPNNPPYASFVEAYRRIGADNVASCIQESSDMFPFAEPQLFAPLRELWLEKIAAEPSHGFKHLSQRACGDASVWQKLDDYVQKNRSAFG